jgi:hypothetical protein
MFDYEKFIFNESKLQEKFQQMENLYSEVYMNFVGLMVTIDENERPDFIELDNLLKSDSSILSELSELEEMAKMNPELEAISPIHPKNNNLSIT